MGLSVAISGGIILTVFMLILLTLPGFMDKMFSIGDITTQVSQHEQKISNTKLSLDNLSQLSGSSKVNFTLNNDGSEKLWNFKDFDLFIEYVGTISGKRTEQLSYNGECLGAVPQSEKWCIQSISNDIADPKILNSGEQASIRTKLSQNLASTTAVVTLVTDNGVTFTTADSSVNTLESLTNVTDTGCALNQIIKVNSTGFWACANDDNTGAITTLESLTNVTDGGCANGQVRKASAGQWICADDNTGSSGITSINGDSTAAQVFSGVAGNLTITDTGAGTLTFNTGYNVVMTQGLAQTVTKGLTLNALTLGGTMNSAGNTIDNVGFIADNSGAEAGAGFIRMGNGAIIAWEASPASTDLTITGDANEDLVLNSGWINVNLGLNPLINSIFDVAGTGNSLTSAATALGDILKSDGTDFKRLARGSANQVLTVNAGGTDIAWATPAGGGITSINADSTAAQVFSGTSGNVTITDTGSGTLSWNTAWNIVTTGGSAQVFTKNLDFGAGTTQKFPNAGMIIRDTDSSNAYTVQGTALAVNKTVQIPASTLATTSFALQGLANDFNGFVQRLSTTFLMRDSDSTHGITFTSPNLSSNLTLNIPLATISPSSIVIDKFANDFNGFVQRLSTTFLMRDSDSTHGITFVSPNLLANRTLNLPLTTQTETLAIRPTIASATNATVQSTASATLVFAGRALTITPVVTGNIMVSYTGYASSGTATNGCTLSMRQGIGAFPRAGAAVSGTAVGINIIGTSATANANVPFAIVYPLTGLTVGTAAWFEPVFSNAVGGTCSLRSTMIVLQEY